MWKYLKQRTEAKKSGNSSPIAAAERTSDLMRIEIVLDVVDRLVAEALDQFLGVGPGDAVVREIVDGDDGEEDGDGENHERRQDAGLEPQISGRCSWTSRHGARCQPLFREDG